MLFHYLNVYLTSPLSFAFVEALRALPKGRSNDLFKLGGSEPKNLLKVGGMDATGDLRPVVH